MDWRAVAVLVHVLAAFWFVAGYVATNVCTEIARRSASDEECRAALTLSGRFDRWLNAPGGSAVAISGLLTLWVYGLPLHDTLGPRVGDPPGGRHPARDRLLAALRTGGRIRGVSQ